MILSIQHPIHQLLNDALQTSKANLRLLEAEVEKIARSCFAVLKAFLFSPQNFIGAKSYSLIGVAFRYSSSILKNLSTSSASSPPLDELFGKGYNHFAQMRLSPQELKPFFKYAAACSYITRCHTDWIAPFNFNVLSRQQLSPSHELETAFPDLEIHENCLFNPKSSMKIALLERENELVVVFGALGSFRPGTQTTNSDLIYPGVENFLGAIPSLYQEADEILKWIKERPNLQNRNITLTGLCLGGSLASYCALRNELKAICLNTLSLGAGLQAQIPSETLQNAEDYVTNIHADGDYYSDNRIFDVIDFIACAIGIKTPGSFGKRFSIPSAFVDRIETHSRILSSFMKHCGQEITTRPSEISDISSW